MIRTQFTCPQYDQTIPNLQFTYSSNIGLFVFRFELIDGLWYGSITVDEADTRTVMLNNEAFYFKYDRLWTMYVKEFDGIDLTTAQFILEVAE